MMNEVLKYRNQIYGLCAIWIVLFHIQGRLGVPEVPVITPLMKMGNAGVDVFMFLSGYCLCLSFKRNSDLRRFFKKRVMRVVVPYVVIAIPYLLYKAFVFHHSMPFFHQCGTFVANLTGLSFWISGFQTTWFVHAIIAMYCFFPLFFHIVSKGKWAAGALLAVTYATILLCAYYLPNYDKNAIALCRFPVFMLGIIMAYYNWDVPLTRRNLVISFIYVVLTIWVFPTKEYMSNHFENGYAALFLFFITMVIPLIILMAKLVGKAAGGINRTLLYIGGLSLEIYIIHVMILNILRDCSIIGNQMVMTPLKGCLLYVIVITLAIVLAQGFSAFTNRFLIKDSIKT